MPRENILSQCPHLTSSLLLPLLPPSYGPSSFISVPLFFLSTPAPGFLLFFFHAFTFLYIQNFLKILLRNIDIVALTNEHLTGLKCSPLCTLRCTVPQVLEIIDSSVQECFISASLSLDPFLYALLLRHIVMYDISTLIVRHCSLKSGGLYFCNVSV